MKHKPLHLILFLFVTLTGGLAYGQGSPGPGPKKPRTLEDYKSSTLKEIASADRNRDGLFPFRVRVVYTAAVRPISTSANEVLHRWAQCCAGNPDHYTRAYLNEMDFVENSSLYQLGVPDRLIADLQADVKVGEAVDLFLIRISTRKTNGKRGSVLLAERFQRAGADHDQVPESVNWIRNNLPLYAERDLKVEAPEPCRLKITEASNNADVSKAVLFLPLADLDPTKVTLSQDRDGGWDLWLNTKGSMRSITFMLYQRGPAEGGQTSKHSLAFRNRQKAEAMAEGFGRAINACTGMKAWK